MPSQVRVDTETALPLQTVENHWYRVFKKYDTDGDGKLNLGELKASITSNGFNHDIPDHAVTKLIKLSDKNRDGHIDFAEFIHLLETDEGRAHFNHLLSQYIHYTVPVRSAGPRRRAAVKGRRGADSPDGEYEDEYSCFPPPLCMVLVSVIEKRVLQEEEEHDSSIVPLMREEGEVEMEDELDGETEDFIRIINSRCEKPWTPLCELEEGLPYPIMDVREVTNQHGRRIIIKIQCPGLRSTEVYLPERFSGILSTSDVDNFKRNCKNSCLLVKHVNARWLDIKIVKC